MFCISACVVWVSACKTQNEYASYVIHVFPLNVHTPFASLFHCYAYYEERHLQYGDVWTKLKTKCLITLQPRTQQIIISFDVIKTVNFTNQTPICNDLSQRARRMLITHKIHISKQLSYR
jgi:hypothetical protein